MPWLPLEPGGHWRICARHGLADVFNLVARPNPVLAPRLRLPGQGHPVAAAMALFDGPALACVSEWGRAGGSDY